MALDEGCFQKCLVSDSVILKPHRIGRNVKDVIIAKLCETFEGVCSRHGFILPGSVRLHRSSPGSLEGANLNGDVRYDLQYHAMVCNPAIGSVIAARVVNMTRFGFLLHSGASPPKGGDAVTPLSSIVETVVSRQATFTDLANANTGADWDAKHIVDLDIIRIGDVVSVRVLGKKFQLNDRHIFVVGRIVERAPDRPTALVPVIGDNNEEDLSVIAAMEAAADERDDNVANKGTDEGSLDVAVTDDDEGSDEGSDISSGNNSSTGPHKRATASPKLNKNHNEDSDSDEEETNEEEEDGEDDEEDDGEDEDGEGEEADGDGEGEGTADGDVTDEAMSVGHVTDDDEI